MNSIYYIITYILLTIFLPLIIVRIRKSLLTRIPLKSFEYSNSREIKNTLNIYLPFSYYRGIRRLVQFSRFNDRAYSSRSECIKQVGKVENKVAVRNKAAQSAVALVGREKEGEREGGKEGERARG